jgi:hypothetical protein
MVHALRLAAIPTGVGISHTDMPNPEGTRLGPDEITAALGAGRKTRLRKTLVQSGAYGRYLPSGHLTYMHRGTLFAAPMDLSRLELTGPPVPVLATAALLHDHGGVVRQS